MKDYQIWEAIGEIDDKLVLEVNDANIIKRENARKRRRIIVRVGLSAAACIVICFAMLWAVDLFNNQEVKDVLLGEEKVIVAVVQTPELYENGDVLPTKKPVELPVKTEGTVVPPNPSHGKTDRGDNDISLSRTYKWRKVNLNRWENEFGVSVIKNSEVEHYFFVLTKDDTLIKGVVVPQKGNKNFIEITVQKDENVQPAEYDFLEESRIAGKSMTIYQQDYYKENDTALYYAEFEKNGVVYTFDGVRQSIDEFKEAIDEIVK